MADEMRGLQLRIAAAALKKDACARMDGSVGGRKEGGLINE